MSWKRLGPNLFLVGAAKCGTTSMAYYLDQHPDVYISRGEPHYFGTDIAYNDPRLNLDQYLKLFHQGRNKSVRGDRSTWYLFSKLAADEIYQYNPQAQIIVMLRNPADMLHSLHKHYTLRGVRETITDFAAALDAEPARRQGLMIPPNARFPESLHYSRIPRYCEQLERFYSRFGRERVRVILLDDLHNDVERVYRDTLRFLGVDSGFQANFDIHNASAPRPNTWLHRLWKKSNLRYRLRATVPQHLYLKLRQLRQQRRTAVGKRQPQNSLDSGLRSRLNEQFREEIDRLQQLIDRDLSGWLSQPKYGRDGRI